MELNKYQEEAAKTAFYEHDDVAYCAQIGRAHV